MKLLHNNDSGKESSNDDKTDEGESRSAIQGKGGIGGRQGGTDPGGIGRAVSGSSQSGPAS